MALSPSKPEPIVGTFSQELLAEMIGTTRSRVSHFMNKRQRHALTVTVVRLRLTRAKFLWTKTDQARRHDPTRLSVSLSFAEASCTQVLE